MIDVIPSDCVCHYDDIAEVASSADLAGDVTIGVKSSADPASVVTACVAFSEECGDNVVIPSDRVCGYVEIAEVASSSILLEVSPSVYHLYL